MSLATRALVGEPFIGEGAYVRAAVPEIKGFTRRVFDTLLAGLDVPEESVPLLVEDTLPDLVIGDTPRMLSAEDVREILAAAS